MKDHYTLTDDVFESQFEDLSLEPALFNHEAHLRLAWILIKKYGVKSATERLCKQIAAFDVKFGDGATYNKTVTVAAVEVVNHFLERSTTNNFADFIAENTPLKYNFKELISRHQGT